MRNEPDVPLPVHHYLQTILAPGFKLKPPISLVPEYLSKTSVECRWAHPVEIGKRE